MRLFSVTSLNPQTRPENSSWQFEIEIRSALDMVPALSFLGQRKMVASTVSSSSSMGPLSIYIYARTYIMIHTHIYIMYYNVIP